MTNSRTKKPALGKQRKRSRAREIQNASARIDKKEHDMTDRNQYKELLDSSSDGLASGDLKGRILFMNTMFAQTFGIENRDDYVGRSIGEVHKSMAEKVHAPDHVLRCIAEAWRKPPVPSEQLIDLFDGRTLRLRTNPVRKPNGTVCGWTISFTDQTRVQMIERMKSELVGRVSHELRSPLASLLGFSELLLHRDVAPVKQRLFLETIYEETKRLTSTINNLLDFQLIESGVEAYDLRPTDLAKVIRTVERRLAGRMNRYFLKIECPSDLPFVLAVEDRLQRVLENLLSNAAKYSPEESEISVSALELRKEKMVRVSVQDHGIGIPEEALPKLSEKFYRVGSSDHDKIGGTGLGLALCREIIQAHRGDITVESALGKGSTFSFTLHAVAAAYRPVDPEADQS